MLRESEWKEGVVSEVVKDDHEWMVDDISIVRE